MKVVYTIWKQEKSRETPISTYKGLKQWIIYIPLLALAFIGFGCGDDEEVTQPPPPEVHLVKDSDTEFHLQWRQRLQGNRAVLVYLVNAHNNEELEELLYFPERTVRSHEYSGYSRVKILPAGEREYVNLPAEAFNATETGTTTIQQFYPYTVGEPDELTFE